MKTLTPSLQTHLESECLTLAQCWKLTRRDDTVLGFADFDANIIYDGVTYRAASGWVPSSIASQSSLAADNLDIEGVLESGAITEADILAGLYDFAQVETFLLNYHDPAAGALSLRRGYLGEVQLNKQQFIAEIRGLMQRLAAHMGQLYSPLCRAQLGDDNCGVEVEALKVSGVITAITDHARFTDSNRAESGGFFNKGLLRFTSGENQGESREVKFYDLGGVFRMTLPFARSIAIGDSYTLTPGCDKTLPTCASRYNNAVNFRGEPHVPGLDRLLETPAARGGGV